MNDVCPLCFQRTHSEVGTLDNDVELDLDFNIFRWKTIEAQLQPHQAVLLYCLVEARGGWVTHDKLLHAAYGAGEYPEAIILSVHFSAIRKILRDAQIPIDIESSWTAKAGAGRYRIKYG